MGPPPAADWMRSCLPLSLSDCVLPLLFFQVRLRTTKLLGMVLPPFCLPAFGFSAPVGPEIEDGVETFVTLMSSSLSLSVLVPFTNVTVRCCLPAPCTHVPSVSVSGRICFLPQAFGLGGGCFLPFFPWAPAAFLFVFVFCAVVSLELVFELDEPQPATTTASTIPAASRDLLRVNILVFRSIPGETAL